MRVLHLIETLGRGGAENLLVTLLPALGAMGVETFVAALCAPHDLQLELEERGIKVVPLEGFDRWNLLTARKTLASLCEHEAVDIVHAHLYFPSIYAALLGRQGDIPVVETFHNLAYGGANRHNVKLAMRRRFRAWAVRSGTSRCFAVSQAVAEHYAEALGLPRVDVLPNAIDLAAIEAVKHSGSATEIRRKLRIVLPGRLVSEKGHCDLLSAFDSLDVRRFSIRFVGGGPLETELRLQAEKRNILLEITGSVPHDQFLAEIAKADIVVIPSRHEGFGIAAAEAMALGKPVVATRAGGLPEVVRDKGILVPVGDPASLREAVETLAQNAELRRTLGQRAAHDARQRFSPTRAAQQLAAAYRELANTDGNCPPNG